MNHLVHLADRVLNRPLLIHPGKAEVILQVLASRIDVSPAALGPDASRFVGSYKYSDSGVPYRVENGVGVLTIDGSLVNRGAWIGANSGLVSYEGIGAQLDAFMLDPKVDAVVLDLNSPGGEATGMFGLADKVRGYRGRKPIVASVNDVAASAAYGIAAQADRIVVSQSSIVGSIGVVLLHVDRSKELANKGQTATLIYAGDHKVDGHPFAPLSDSVKADIQREVDSIYGLFVGSVGDGRPALGAKGARATQARVFMGADAVANGLADVQGSLDDAMRLARSLTSTKDPGAAKAGRLSGQNAIPAPAAEATQGTPTMDWKDLTLDTLRQNRSDLVAAIETSEAVNARVAAATAAGAAAERDRILAIQGAMFPGQEKLAAELIADGKTTAGDAALKFNQAEKQAGGKRVADLRAADETVRVPAAPSQAAPGRSTQAETGTTEAEWKAEFAASAALRAEFKTESAYLAYKKADAEGRFRVLTGRAARAA